MGLTTSVLYKTQTKNLSFNTDTQICADLTLEELSGQLFDLPDFKNLKNFYVYAGVTALGLNTLIKVPKNLTVQEWCDNTGSFEPDSERIIYTPGNFLPFGVEAVESNLFTLAFIVFGIAVILPGNKNYLWFMNLWWARVALIIIGCFMLQRSANPETKYSWNDVVSGNLPALAPIQTPLNKLFAKK